MKHELQKSLSEGNFGLEKESLRVNKYTLLPSVSDHPFGSNPNISRDFCEAQTEIITPVCRNTDELFDTLHTLNSQVRRTLARQDEILWNHSNPPEGYDEKAIRIAHFEGMEAEKEEYRKYLREKYGIFKMLLSGIHFNFSFTEKALASLAEIAGKDSAGKDSAGDRSRGESYSDGIYLKLAAASMKYAWLITYLTAASPISSVNSHGKDHLHDSPESFSSLRCSIHGYWNSFVPVLDYGSLSVYIDSIQALVDSGRLYSAWELYLPVRLKPRGANVLENLRAGISHIELRMLDINPLEKDGIRKEDVDFIHLLLIMWAAGKPVLLDGDAQRRAVRNMQNAALLDADRIWIEEPGGIRLPIRNAGLHFLAEMDLFYETWEDPYIHHLIQFERQKFLDHSRRYAERVLSETVGSRQTATA